MEILMTIFSLAISAASLAAIFVTKEKKTRIVVIFILAFLICLLVLRGAEWLRYRNHVEEAESTITSLLSGNNPMSFEEIRLKLDLYDYRTLEEALDNLRKSRMISDGILTLTSEKGNKFQVRIFNGANFAPE